MTTNQARYALRVLCNEIPAGMDEQTAEWAAIAIVSRFRRAMVRAADRTREHFINAESAEWAEREERAAELAHAAELARRAEQRAAERAELARWAGELARHAGYNCRAAEREERAAGVRAADAAADATRFTFNPPALASVTLRRAAERAAGAAEDGRTACRLAQRFARAV